MLNRVLKTILWVFVLGAAAEGDVLASGSYAIVEDEIHDCTEPTAVDTINDVASTENWSAHVDIDNPVETTMDRPETSCCKFGLSPKIMAATALGIGGTIAAGGSLVLCSKTRRLNKSNKILLSQFLEEMRPMVTPKAAAEMEAWDVSCLDIETLDRCEGKRRPKKKPESRLATAYNANSKLLQKNRRQKQVDIYHIEDGRKGFIKIPKQAFIDFCKSKGRDFVPSQILKNVAYYNEFVNQLFKIAVDKNNSAPLFGLTIFNPKTRMKFVIALVHLMNSIERKEREKQKKKVQENQIKADPNQESQIEADPNQESQIEADPNQEYQIHADPNQEYQIHADPNQEDQIHADPNQEDQIHADPNQEDPDQDA